MEKIWSDHINSETERLNANQARIDKLEKRGLSKAQFADVRRLTDALYDRIKSLESKATLLATRVAELEAMTGATTHSRTLRLGVTDSSHSARV